jgi:hypothetical protein
MLALAAAPNTQGRNENPDADGSGQPLLPLLVSENGKRREEHDDAAENPRVGRYGACIAEAQNQGERNSQTPSTRAPTSCQRASFATLRLAIDNLLPLVLKKKCASRADVSTACRTARRSDRALLYEGSKKGR